MTGARDFWSRRRAAVAAEEEAETAERQDVVEDDARARLDAMSDAELLEALNLPEPETLGAGDDFSVFMTRTVPDRLRRRALRTLWRTNPVLANLDGLVDYDADFTDRATVVENLKTAYQVGRGMLAHVEKLAATAAESRDGRPADATPEDPPERAESEKMTEGVPAAAAPDADASEEEDAMEDAPAPRRMVFVYEGGTL